MQKMMMTIKTPMSSKNAGVAKAFFDFTREKNGLKINASID